MFDVSWNSAIHQIEVAELAKKNLHVFRIEIQDHGTEEVAFHGATRDEARASLLKWVASEPFVSWEA